MATKKAPAVSRTGRGVVNPVPAQTKTTAAAARNVVAAKVAQKAKSKVTSVKAAAVTTPPSPARKAIRRNIARTGK